MDQSIFVIFNPAAGRGRGEKRIDGYLALLRQHLPSFEYSVTTHAGHEVELTDQAIDAGATAIVAIGGDGTWSVVADRIVRSGRADVTLGLLPAGTGNDFGKSLGIRFEHAESAVRGIAAGCSRRIDVGRVDGRHFLNIVGFGFDIAVIDDADGFPILKGDALYQFCALRQLFRFRGLMAEISSNASRPQRNDHLMLVIANANYFGGSFHIAPQASLEDGMLDAVSIYNVGPLARARLFSRVAKGQHERDKNVSIQQSRSFRIAFTGPVRYEVDGEVYTSNGNALDVESVPGALNVFTPIA